MNFSNVIKPLKYFNAAYVKMPNTVAIIQLIMQMFEMFPLFIFSHYTAFDMSLGLDMFEKRMSLK